MASQGSNDEENEPSGLEEVSWRSAATKAPGPLLYDPLEPEPVEPVPSPEPQPVDSSALLFRVALGTAALLVLLVFGWGYWWSGSEPHRNVPKAAAVPRSAVAPAPPVVTASPPAGETRKPAAEPTPKPAPAKPERTQIAARVKPETLPKPAAVPAETPKSRRLPQPWEEGPQPPDLLKPGPGVEEPVPLALPRYGYPAAARGTGLRADVRVAVLVDEKGQVIDARVREGAPPDLGFSETALAAAKRMSFQPATRYDVPGKMWTEVILEFAE